jgi:hypothetical protein
MSKTTAKPWPNGLGWDVRILRTKYAIRNDGCVQKTRPDRSLTGFVGVSYCEIRRIIATAEEAVSHVVYSIQCGRWIPCD